LRHGDGKSLGGKERLQTAKLRGFSAAVDTFKRN